MYARSPIFSTKFVIPLQGCFILFFLHCLILLLSVSCISIHGELDRIVLLFPYHQESVVDQVLLYSPFMVFHFLYSLVQTPSVRAAGIHGERSKRNFRNRPRKHTLIH